MSSFQFCKVKVKNDAAIMIAGNAENDHVSCDSTVKGSMTTLTEGSTHQTSLDLFTVATPGGGNKPKVKAVANHDGVDGDRIDELAKSVDKILKIVSSTKPDSDDVTLPIATLVSGGDATNLQDFISVNRDFTLMEKDGLKYLTCNICAAYLSTPSCAREKSQGKRLPTSSTKGSLCHGLYLEDVDYISYTSGKNTKWYRFKKTLVDHITGRTSKTHRDAVRHHHLQKPLRKREALVLKNQYVLH